MGRLVSWYTLLDVLCLGTLHETSLCTGFSLCVVLGTHYWASCMSRDTLLDIFDVWAPIMGLFLEMSWS